VADVAARLIPFPFFFPGFQIRATQEWLIGFQAQLESAKASNAPRWAIETYQSFVDQVNDAIKANRGMTDPIALARQNGSDWAPVRDGNPPAAVVYSKPMIVLADEFTASAGDLFAAVIQDNDRAPVVGMRTNGAGGNVETLDTGFYSESSSGVTESLMVRNHTVVTPDLPPAPYVENIGVRPDIPLDYMTRDNLMGGGRPFVGQFTAIIVNQIQQSQPGK
jgi:C-terminal processing protease CtpA/Prc